MSSDDARRIHDAPWRPRGPGHSITFRCDTCRTPKSTLGRRKRGIFYDCAQCVELRHGLRNEAKRKESMDQPA